MKKSCYILIIAFVCATLSITCLATDKHFTDIPANAWYYSDVQNAVGNGLINGKTATTFAPEDNLTYAEAVKLAACMYKLSTEGNVDFVQSSPWYMPFVEYAKANNIISKDYDWEKKTTRAEYMDIFSKALPSEKLNEVNNVPDNSIPDVPMTHPYAPSIYKMYRSGIVQGSDAQFSCKPAENIKRSEVAAIITRMMDTNSRKSFAITVPEHRTLYNTGYTLYDAKINEYYQAMNADEGSFNKNDNSSINNFMVGYARNYDGKLYYSTYDINKNGVPELIFSNGTHFIDVYTLNNGSLVKLFENCYFGERSRLHILTNGSLLTEGSNSASSSSYQIYRLSENGSLKSKEAYYFNTNGPDASVKSYTYISSNEYVERVNNYISHSVFNSLNWKLFADMRLITQKSHYNSASIALKNGDYLSAIEQFLKAGDYNDASTMVFECYYLYGKNQMENSDNYLFAADQFLKAGNYKDASIMVLECYYLHGKNQMEMNYVTEGLEYLSKCRGYRDTDEIIHSYYYKEGVKAFNKLIESFQGAVIGNEYQDAVENLTLCEGYNNSNDLLEIAEKLYYVWSKMGDESKYNATLSGMNVDISENNITIKKDRFLPGTFSNLTLNFNIEKQGFTAEINDMYDSFRNYSEAVVFCALIRLFTDIKKTDDLSKKLRDDSEWTFGENSELFFINYGGYKIDVRREEKTYYISVSK